MPLRLTATLLGLCFAGTLAAAPVEVARIDSPDKVLSAVLELDDGRLGYRIDRFGETVIASSRMGFALRDGRLERSLKLVEQSNRSVDETWEQPWGESRHVRNRFNELRARFTETNRHGREFAVVFRVYDDGVGFRYEFPKQAALGDVIIDDELTEFVFAGPATAWWIPAGEWNRYEYLYNRTPVEEVTQAHTPITVRTGDGLHIAIHEAALVDYASMWLNRVEARRFRAQLAPASEGWKVRRTTPFHTPWRTLQIADRAGGLVESNLILNLNEPNALGDVSWVKPAKYVGVWWAMHLDEATWGSGPKHGATTGTTMRYIDFAAEHGFRGVLVEGWNPGWDGDWFSNGWGFDFTRPAPDFDLTGLAAYAKAKGVHLVGHHETACAVSHYERQLERAFALYAKHGIEQVKTGYVCDAGQIERQDGRGPVIREWHDGQWMSRHHLRVLQAAAKHRIAINAHEPIKDTGLRRTYPNWLAREGARGMEYNAWGQPFNPPEHEANLVFTRMLSGPMDFTPGVLSLTGQNGRPIESTLAKQLALYVVLYSPIQMAADLPENYARHMDAFQFIKDVPTDWAQTRALAGEVGDYAVIARQDRHSADWYLGAVTDEHGRSLDLPLSFLTPGTRYRAQIYRDGDGAHWRTARFEFVREEREVTSADVLNLRLAAGGGQAIRFVPLPARPLPRVASGRVERLADFPSRHVGARNVDVWLPDGYPKDAPYAVLYMHDGQMLFDATITWNHQEWRADEVAGELIASGKTRPFIIVGVDNAGAARASEYYPQKPFASLPKPLQDMLYAMTYGDSQKLFAGPIYSDRYLQFLVEELKPHIDARYAVSPVPRDTLLMGSSLGGLISMYALGEYPDVFGAAACLSTHWPGRIGDSPDNPVPAIFLDYIEKTFPDAGRHRVWFDHGTETLDASYADRQREVDRRLRTKGYTAADWRTQVFPGAEHNETAWSARLHLPLQFLLARPEKAVD